MIEYVQKITNKQTNMQIRNPEDFLGFMASTQLHNIRGKQHGSHQVKSALLQLG